MQACSEMGVRAKTAWRGSSSKFQASACLAPETCTTPHCTTPRLAPHCTTPHRDWHHTTLCHGRPILGGGSWSAPETGISPVLTQPCTVSYHVHIKSIPIKCNGLTVDQYWAGAPGELPRLLIVDQSLLGLKLTRHMYLVSFASLFVMDRK